MTVGGGAGTTISFKAGKTILPNKKAHTHTHTLATCHFPGDLDQQEGQTSHKEMAENCHSNSLSTSSGGTGSNSAQMASAGQHNFWLAPPLRAKAPSSRLCLVGLMGAGIAPPPFALRPWASGAGHCLPKRAKPGHISFGLRKEGGWTDCGTSPPQSRGQVGLCPSGYPTLSIQRTAWFGL